MSSTFRLAVSSGCDDTVSRIAVNAEDAKAPQEYFLALFIKNAQGAQRTQRKTFLLFSCAAGTAKQYLPFASSASLRPLR